MKDNLPLEIVSMVYFADLLRVQYLSRSWESFHKMYDSMRFRHIVLDGSEDIGIQRAYYDKLNIEYYHRPESYSSRLKEAVKLVSGDYFLFFPDDFQWIFRYPLAEAIFQSRKCGVDELKLVCRGDTWMSSPGAEPKPWYRRTSKGVVVAGGEVLKTCGNIHISKRFPALRRDFHEQFSLACHVLRTSFARSIFDRLPATLRSAAECERQIYRVLRFRRYTTGYYRMWTPAFHFIDVNAEPNNNKREQFAATELHRENFEAFNAFFHTKAGD